MCVDTGPLGPNAHISPYVGIRSDAVERLRAELMDLPDGDWIGTIGANVGYVLGGEYRSWEGIAPLQPVLDAIHAGLEKLAPYMSLKTIGPVFAHDWAARNPGAPYALVVIALLNQDRNGVEASLRHARSIMCVRDDEVCDQFKAFEERVRTRLTQP